MAVWPAYAKLLLPGYGEDFDPSIERTEMERGVPKERILNTQVMATIEGTVLFASGADVAAFEAWYFVDLGRVGWFALTHPRTRAQITARFQAGRLGRLSPISPRSGAASRDVVLEYLRG